MSVEHITFGVTDRETALSLSGIELLQGIRDGRLPAPTIARTMNFRLETVEDGHVVFVGEPSAEVLNPLGGIHGGFAATLLDSSLGCACHTKVPRGSVYSTVELKVNMTRAIRPDSGAMRASGTVVHAGRTIVTAEGRLTDDAGKIYAHGTATCLIMTP